MSENTDDEKTDIFDNPIKPEEDGSETDFSEGPEYPSDHRHPNNPKEYCTCESCERLFDEVGEPQARKDMKEMVQNRVKKILEEVKKE